MSISAKNNNYTRPRKSGAAKNRRQLEHRRRLLALGVTEGEIKKLSASKIRTLITNGKALKVFVDARKTKKN